MAGHLEPRLPGSFRVGEGGTERDIFLVSVFIIFNHNSVTIALYGP